jgi:hypothetical protein
MLGLHRAILGSAVVNATSAPEIPMHALLLALTLTGGGDLVLLDAPPELARQLRPVLTARGFDVVTTPAVRDTLDRAAVAMSLGALDEPAPSGLPADVLEEWKQATSACRAIAGAPYGASNAKARSCGGDIPEGLWVRFVESSHATSVVEASSDGSQTPSVTLTLFALDDRERPRAGTQLVQKIPPAEVARLGGHLAAMLAGTEGTTESRRLTHYMIPVPPAGATDPAAGGPVHEGDAIHAPALPIPAACKAPATIAVSPKDSPLARNLEEAYARSMAAHAGPTLPALACTVTLQTTPDKMLGLTGFDSELRCGKHHAHATFGALMASAGAPGVQSKLVDRLLGPLIGSLCGVAQRAPVEP